MRRISLIALAVATAALFARCEKSSRKPENNKLRREKISQASGPAPTEVTQLLHHAGGKTRRVLRFKLTPGTKVTGTVDMRLAVEMTMSGRKAPEMKIPTVRLQMEVNVTEVAKGGDFTSSTAVTRVKMLPDGRLPEAALNMLRQKFRLLQGVTWTETRTPRGKLVRSKVHTPEQMPQAARQLLQGLEQSMRLLMPYLPEAPVGEGARWTMRMPVKAAGVKSGQVMQFELQKLTENGARLLVAIKQWAPPQTVNEGMPSGSSMRVKHMAGQGKATVMLRTDRPLSGVTMDLMSDNAMTLDINGQKHEMAVKVGVKLIVRPD